MQKAMYAVTVAALCLVLPYLAAAWIPGGNSRPSQDPFCQNTRCRGNDVCRVIQQCRGPNSCVFRPICLSRRLSLYHSGGCRVGEPLLTGNLGGFQTRTCYNGHGCPRGFYCSSDLQDAPSRCCPGTGTGTGTGTGPRIPGGKDGQRPFLPTIPPIIDPTAPGPIRPPSPPPLGYRPSRC
ncbi:hypothetical protein ACOMHN_014541 [Nucella lapillus]